MATAIRSIEAPLDYSPRHVGDAVVRPLHPSRVADVDRQSRRTRLHLSRIDRYLGGAILTPFAAVLTIVVLLLTLENVPRLMNRLMDVGQPMPLLGNYMVALLPEYLAIGLLVALYLGIALTFRSLALRGELDMLAGSGLSDMAILKAPLIIAVAVALLVFAVRGYGQPLGERRVATLGNQIHSGAYGMRIEPGRILHLAGGDIVSFDRFGAAPNSFTGIIVQHDDTMFAAAAATLRFASDRRIHLLLERGNFVRRAGPGIVGSGRFETLRLALPLETPLAAPLRLRERLDRMTIAGLLAVRGDPLRPLGVPDAAGAVLLARLSVACFCLVLPFIAFAFGIPPKRSRSAIGLGVGIVLIVLFIRMNAWIEDRPASAASLYGALIGGWALLAWGAMRVTARHGAGAIESGLIRATARPLALLRRPFPTKGYR